MRLTAGIVFLVTSSMSAFAQSAPNDWQWDLATSLERQAYSCGALMMILTVTSDQPEYLPLNRSAMAAGMVLNAVGAEESSNRLKARVNNGFVHGVRDKEMKLASAAWQIDKQKSVRRFWECLVWGASSIQALQNDAIKGPGEIFYPSTFPAIGNGVTAQREKFEKWVNVSMETWQKLGIVTPGDIKEVIRRDATP